MELEITFRNKNKIESSLIHLSWNIATNMEIEITFRNYKQKWNQGWPNLTTHPAGGGADWLPHGHQALRGDQMGEQLLRCGQIYFW